MSGRFDYGDVKTVEFANVTAATAITEDPPPNRKVVILGLALTLDADGEFTITDGSTSVANVELLADTPFVLPLSELGWYEGADDAQVTLAVSGVGAAANGLCRYVVVRA